MVGETTLIYQRILNREEIVERKKMYGSIITGLGVVPSLVSSCPKDSIMQKKPAMTAGFVLTTEDYILASLAAFFF